MSTSERAFGAIILGAALLAGCSRDSGSAFSPADAGDGSGGAATGGAASPGAGGTAGQGNGGTASGGGGMAAAGGSVAAGGSAAAGGAGGTTPGGCAAPADRKQTAMCVTLAPESITPQSDPALDEKGVFLLEVFDTPTPPQKDASSVALIERVVPANPGTGEVSLSAIPMQRLVGTLPAVVYVRAVFVDNPARLAQGAAFGWGAWVGGIELGDGFQDKEPILPVKVTVGQGNALTLQLVALRRLTVKVHASATPVGDGQGPLTAVVAGGADAAKKPPAFGLARAACADISKDVTLTGFVIGKGPYWITGVLNDLGLPGDLPPGALAALDVTATAVTIPQMLTYAAGDYTPTASIDLSYVVPLTADAGGVPPNSCADLSARDGGLPEAGP